MEPFIMSRHFKFYTAISSRVNLLYFDKIEQSSLFYDILLYLVYSIDHAMFLRALMCSILNLRIITCCMCAFHVRTHVHTCTYV